MIKLYQNGVYLKNYNIIEDIDKSGLGKEEISKLYQNTMAYKILKSHNQSAKTEKSAPLNIKFD